MKTTDKTNLGTVKEKVINTEPKAQDTPTRSIFAKSDYGTSKVTIEIDSDVLELARCLCFVVPTIAPRELLENVIRKGIIDASTPFAKEIKTTFKRNPYDRITKYLMKGGD
ncbi:MAG: hypothetical protein Q4D93_03170 [Porphyromonas sp.]|nr:hypothetical protein [Porphyromonas sp.]